MEVMSIEDFVKEVTFTGCAEHCKGGQHVSRTCSYIVGECKSLDISVRIGIKRSMLENKELVLRTLYRLYLENKF